VEAGVLRTDWRGGDGGWLDVDSDTLGFAIRIGLSRSCWAAVGLMI
jgi:hypothetical protein